jgi:hypothetical protein
MHLKLASDFRQTTHYLRQRNFDRETREDLNKFIIRSSASTLSKQFA